jgi:IclR family acetate operon transcriptional repressor
MSLAESQNRASARAPPRPVCRFLRHSTAVQALDRLTSILEIVAAHGRPVGAAEVARASDLPLSTIVRLMRQLAEAGLLDRVGDGARYSLGARLFALIGAGAARVDLAEAAASTMRELRDRTGETVSLHVRRGVQRVCLAEVQSQHQVRRVVPPGMIQELCGTATGEVLLLDTHPAELEAVLVHAKLSRVARRRLAERLGEIAERNYAINEDPLENLTGISAPIRAAGLTVAALTISGPTVRFNGARAQREAGALVAAVASLSTP